MAEWKREDVDFAVVMPGHKDEVWVKVTLFQDETGQEPRQYLIGDDPDSPGLAATPTLSAMESPVRDQVIHAIWQATVEEAQQSLGPIERLLYKVETDPRKARWFVQDHEGRAGDKEPSQIYAVSLWYEPVVTMDSLRAELVTRNDELPQDLDWARQNFPDEKHDELRSSLDAIGHEQHQALSRAAMESAYNKEHGKDFGVDM